MGAFKDKILDELYKNNYAELYDVIDKLESDVDVANYISSGKGYYSKKLTNKDLEGMPEFRKALYSDLKTGEVDIDKEFGKDWYKNYEQIPSDQIKFVADKQGVSYGKLVKEMGEQATKKRRYDIAHDGTIAGGITGFVAPRSVEAIERGESPSAKDAALDITQNVAYAAPWARVSAPLARFGLTGRIMQGAAGNALTPTIMESADAIAYNDPDNNPRSDFSGTDVATETAVNMTAPWLLRGMAMGAGRFTTGKGRELANKFMELGTNRETRNDVSRAFNMSTIKNSPHSVAKTVANEINQGTADNLSAQEIAAGLSYLKNPSYKAEYERLFAKLAYKNSKVKPEGSKLFKVGDSRISYNEAKLPFTDKELEFIIHDPDLVKLLPNAINKLPSNQRVRIEEEIKNYLTNEFGSAWYDQQSPWTRVPIVGPRIEQKLKEEAKQDSIQAKRDSIIYDILKKYGEPRGL